MANAGHSHRRADAKLLLVLLVLVVGVRCEHRTVPVAATMTAAMTRRCTASTATRAACLCWSHCPALVASALPPPPPQQQQQHPQQQRNDRQQRWRRDEDALHAAVAVAV